AISLALAVTHACRRRVFVTVAARLPVVARGRRGRCRAGLVLRLPVRRNGGDGLAVLTALETGIVRDLRHVPTVIVRGRRRRAVFARGRVPVVVLLDVLGARIVR